MVYITSPFSGMEEAPEIKLTELEKISAKGRKYSNREKAPELMVHMSLRLNTIQLKDYGPAES